MNAVEEFQAAHKKFTEGLAYITKNNDSLQADLVRFKIVSDNFKKRFSDPMDKLWLELSDAERKKLAPIYLWHKAQEDPTVKNIIKTFNAKVVKVTPIKDDGLFTEKEWLPLEEKE